LCVQNPVLIDVAIPIDHAYELLYDLFMEKHS